MTRKKPKTVDNLTQALGRFVRKHVADAGAKAIFVLARKLRDATERKLASWRADVLGSNEVASRTLDLALEDAQDEGVAGTFQYVLRVKDSKHAYLFDVKAIGGMAFADAASRSSARGEARNVDTRYFGALEDLLDAVETMFSEPLSPEAVQRTFALYNEAAKLAKRQDRYRTDDEIGPKQLKRFETALADPAKQAIGRRFGKVELKP